jgi:hypothetical protein
MCKEFLSSQCSSHLSSICCMVDKNKVELNEQSAINHVFTYLRFGIHTTVNIKSDTSCGLAEIYRCFGRHFTSIYSVVKKPSKSILVDTCSLGLFFEHEDGGNMFLRNIE